jgi:DNA processing protein
LSTLKYWIWLSTLRGIRPRVKNLLLERFETPQGIYFAGEGDYAALEGITRRELEILKHKEESAVLAVMEACAREHIQIITLQDAEYPERLKHIYDPPVVLYVKGRLPIVDNEVAIGTVGTRKATPYGLKMGRQLGFELTKGGALVISGLAAGVDSAAAEGALQAGGSCIGVLGTAIDEVYPKFNMRLFDDVAAVGALVSEYAPGTKTGPEDFPLRNRIISGLSVGVTIIEAPLRSGALITASLALEQGRDVFAVPGNADSSACAGSNRLIKEGAKAVTEARDILEDYVGLFPGKLKLFYQAPKAPEKAVVSQPTESSASETKRRRNFLRRFREKQGEQRQRREPETGKDFVGVRRPVPSTNSSAEQTASLDSFTEPQRTILTAMQQPSMHVDEIIGACGLPASVVLAELTILQISGAVTQEQGKRFTRNIAEKQ